MKSTIIFGASLMALALPALGAGLTELKDDKQKLSYSIGMGWGNTLKNNSIEVDFEALLQGMKDKAAGQSTLLTDADAQQLLNHFQNERRRQQEEKRQQEVAVNRAAGEKFLAENKTKPGVVTLPSGLQYKVLTEGSGSHPRPHDTVEVNYRGRLIDGTEFDSSYRDGQSTPVKFSLNAVIKGWTEGVGLMKKGGKNELYIPADLAYGDRANPKIPAGSTLIFEVELLDVKPVEVPPTPPVTSDIIKVPSKEEMERGAKIEVIKPEEVERLQKEAQAKQQN